MESKAEGEVKSISSKRQAIKAEMEEKAIKAEMEEKPESKPSLEDGNPESRRYYLARRTLIAMLSDRGYVVPDMDAQLRHSLAEACSLRLTAHPASDPSRKILVIFCEAYQTKKRNAVEILSQIVDKERLDKVILIIQSKMSFQAQKVLDEYPVKVETFLDRETESKAEREEKSKSKISKRRKVVEDGTQESLQYYRARRTLIEMLRDRGYVVPDIDRLLRQSLADFRRAFGDHPTPANFILTAYHALDSSRKIRAIFCEAHLTREEDAVDIVSEDVKLEMVEKVILITHSEIVIDARKVRVQVETFVIKDLEMNPTMWMEPLKFEILSGEEKDQVLKRKHLNVNMGPIITQKPESHMLARYFEYRKGQVVKLCYYQPGPRVAGYICIV